ncbi:hypothetical protein BU17DRAFT_48078 [Hysterangium stoloniferum]|nr:hypothetical protein BU17DRAFT_48078 [Hysterangium stoloniferum]
MELEPNQSSAFASNSRDTRQTRSSTRVKQTKDDPASSSKSNSLRRTRSTAQLDQSDSKGKGKAVPDDSSTRPSKRARRTTVPATTSPLTISEPVRDPKGKKRAAPDPDSDLEQAASPAPYALRSRKAAGSMPKKQSRTVSTKGKSSAVKAKAAAAASSSASRMEDEDVEMMDVEDRSDDEEDHHKDDDEDDDDDEDEENSGGGGGAGASSAPGGIDEGAALALFGDFRGMGSYMVTLSNRLKTILNNIKPAADPTTRLVALQELSEVLSISTEDTLSGYFQVDAFVKELVKIMGGKGEAAHDDDEDVPHAHDEDVALAAALAMSAGGAFPGDDNLEAQVLACRCLANLMEAMPGSAHTVVYHGAVPVLCSKLVEISYIDLAEQTLSTLEKISEEYPSAIVREGGLAALLNYLDFFSTTVQRTALQAASNCCRNASPDSFTMIRDVFPILRNVLGYSDQRLVEYACLCVIRIIESYHRTSPGLLETLIDTDLIRAIHALLLPAGGSPLISSNTYMLFLRALGTAAKASPKISVALLEADVVDILYQILTGVLPPQNSSHKDEGAASGGQGFGGGLADMAVMENLAHRPKDQVEEALSLISELMPPLPKDGVFDNKGYTEKSLARLVKVKAKAERAAQRAASAASSAAPSKAPTPSLPEDNAPTPDESAHSRNTEPAESSSAKEAPVSRMELLRSKLELVALFTKLLVPVLVDVYAASVASHVRTKTLTALLKAVSFLDGDDLKNALKCVPVASFVGSILSTRDHPTLVLSALQLVELLLYKMPSEYKGAFRREGVLHEIEMIADQKLTPKPKDEPSPAEPFATAEGLPPPPAVVLPPTRRSTHALDPQDAVTMRARVVRFKYLSGTVELEDAVFAQLRSLVVGISEPHAKEDVLRQNLHHIADLFASPNTSVSSFELLQSGLVDGLLEFATADDRIVGPKRRQQLLFETFIDRGPSGSDSPNGQTPFATLVKKLQESLTRMESFEVVTVSQGIDDSKRNSASMLARQLRLRLVAAEDSDVPRNCSNIIVSIHAIATFQALNDYLRPRVSGLLAGMGGSRLSGMLAALAASGMTPGSLGRGSLGASVGSSSHSAPPPAPSGEPSAGGRRRSMRLSARSAGPAIPPDVSPPIVPQAGSETAVNDDDEDIHDDFPEDDYDAEACFFSFFAVFEEDMDPDASVTETTVTLNVADDGSKVEAQTPDGTRVATPSFSRGPPAALPSSSSAKTSYAAALKAKPSDWHLEFSMDDQILPLDLTIYGAVYQHEARKALSSVLNPNALWSGVYTVKFKKVPGPPPISDGLFCEPLSRDRSLSPLLSSVPLDAPHSKILRLLRVLCKLNEQGIGRSRHILADSSFINNKLTAKLTRQLEEPMIVASSCLPEWALELPQHFPFLFPFSTRYSFLQSTSFGYARLILKWQSQQTRTQDSSRRDDAFGFLGRLQRQKVRISRKHILESAVKVFELYGSSSSVLEVEYFEEVGTGLGPTLEFYSLVSKEFARRDLKIWRDADSMVAGPYVHHPRGLFPAPLGPLDLIQDRGQKRTHLFQVIGQFTAKALLDSRIIDMSLNKIFIKLILEEDVPQTIATLHAVDPDLANSLSKLQTYVETRRVMESDAALVRINVSYAQLNIEDLALDFTLPGYDIELKPGGRNILVTAENVDEYIAAVLDAIIGKGAVTQAKSFREGFSKVFPVDDLKVFSADELIMMFGNAEEDWSVETLSEALKADHGFNVESRAIRDLVELMASYDLTLRREYLQFITGSPKLPIGGFRGLNPPLTVVRKPHEAPLSADDYLPSVMTCVNYLKLPEYSTKVVMAEKLATAMKEGVGSFHLS